MHDLLASGFVLVAAECFMLFRIPFQRCSFLLLRVFRLWKKLIGRQRRRFFLLVRIDEFCGAHTETERLGKREGKAIRANCIKNPLKNVYIPIQRASKIFFRGMKQKRGAECSPKRGRARAAGRENINREEKNHKIISARKK